MGKGLGGRHGIGQGSTKVEPTYFDSGDHRLFGWLHQPSFGTARGTGLVICNPFGFEAVCSHRSLRTVAAMAAGVGIPTLRFDYQGTGDSADIDPHANQLEVWSNDVLAAIDALQRLTGVERVYLLGIRLGALLAVMAARHRNSLAGIILISPIISGRRYLRELRTAQRAASLAAISEPGRGNESQTIGDGSMEASGFPLSAATLAALTGFDLPLSFTPGFAMLIIDDSRMPVARGWVEAISAAAEIKYLALSGLIEMIYTAPHDAKPSEAILSTVLEWLQRDLVGDMGVAEVGSGDRSDEYAQASNTLTLPGNEPTRDATLTEQALLIGSDPAIFGILTRPRQDEMRRRAVILINAGATYHAGPNRFYVSLARRWALSGYFVLRLDLAGLGDSDTRCGRTDNEVFPAAALDDIRVAIEFLRNRCAIYDVTLCGFCSGAYHALRAAVAQLPVNRILLVNPENFFWKQGTDLHALEPAEVVRRTRGHRERIFSLAAWKRLLTGQIDLWRIARIYVQRPLLALESQLRDCARLLGVRLPHDLGSELETISARGVRVVFIFAYGEAGIELLHIQAGSSIKRLKDRCSIHIIEGADHIFSRSAPRAILGNILNNELFAINPSRAPPIAPSGMDKNQIVI
jgi:pimeloyl-ACP methyl ester carboxylesterase